jgi:hypothetical protein
MHVENEKIVGILRSGKYHFLLSEDGCSVELKCNDSDPLVPESLKGSDNLREKLFQAPKEQRCTIWRSCRSFAAGAQ